MKIVIYLDSIGVKAGVERVCALLANEWCTKGYEIYIISNDSLAPAFPLNENVKLISLGHKRLVSSGSKFSRLYHIVKKNIVIQKKLKAHFKQINPDYIYSTTIQTAMALLFFNKKYKVIASDHGAFKAYNWIYKIYKVLFYRFFYAIVCLTKADSQIYKKINKKTYCIPNFLSFETKKGSALNNKKAISVGRLVKEKNFTDMIDIWAEIVKTKPDWILEIYGDGPLKKQLQNQIDKLNLSSHVLLMGTTKNIQKKYIEASIFLMTSVYEGFGMVLLEAMQCGLPVISYDTLEGVKEILDGQFGINVECYNKDKFINELLLMIEDTKKRKLYSNKAKKRSNEYNKEKILEEWWKLFKGDKI